MTNEAKKEEVGYIINFSADLGSAKALSLTGNLPKGASLQDLNEEFDKIRAAFDRQQAKSVTLTLEQEIERLADQKKNIFDTLDKLDKKADEKGGSTVSERQQRDTVVTNIASLTAQIESKQKLLQKLSAEAK